MTHINVRKKQRQLLFIAYSFPPYRGIAAVRLGCIAKYFADIGWKITVMALHPHDHPRQGNELIDTQVIESEWRARGVELILVRQLSYLSRPANNLWRRVRCRWEWEKAKVFGASYLAPWVRQVYVCSGKIDFAKVDVILASGDPFEQFALARCLGAKHRKPYVFDYRDLWLNGLCWSSSEQVCERVLGWQRELLAGVAGVSVVSPSMAEFMDKRFELGARLHVISNGYDPSVLDNVAPLSFESPSIVYSGFWFPPHRPIEPFYAALAQLQNLGTKSKWTFRYYGHQTKYVLDRAGEFGIGERVVTGGVVPWNESIALLRGAKVAVVMTSTEEIAGLINRGILTGKIFELIGLGVPVLLIAPHNADVRKVLEETGGGRAFTANETSGIAKFLQEVLAGAVPERRRPETYSWPVLIQQFEKMLLEAISRQGGST
jgi:glycosyltransferase involved in cell wall biosynthesis